MSQSAIHQLNYAAPRTSNVKPWHFWTGSAVLAFFGIVANLAFIIMTTGNLHRASWVRGELMQNPRAYGREIDRATIQKLREPTGVWVAGCAFGGAAAFGVLLATELMMAAIQARWKPDSSYRRLQNYRRWKPAGTALTVLTFFWTGCQMHAFWCTASRHVPVGSGPPYLVTLLLLVCAMLPIIWTSQAIRNRND
jgi:hypothetical protein